MNPSPSLPIVRVLADTHVHLYPAYDLGLAFEHAFTNLARLEKKAGKTVYETERFLLLTERNDCHAFRDLKDGRVTLAEPYRVAETGEPNSLRIEGGNGNAVVLVAGRQVVSSERVEVLGLGVDSECPDGLSLDEVLHRLREEGAAPVLSWAPGKWFFRRGALVRQRMRAADLVDLLFLGDTTLRPIGWPTPSLFEEGGRRGIQVLAGSDPLPFEGEEKQLGRFGVVVEGPFDTARPAASALALFRDPDFIPEHVGRRDFFPGMLRRLWANKAARSA